MGTKEPKAPEAPVRVELLTTEFHPIDGRTERWRMSDGSVQAFTTKQGWQ